MLMQDVMQMVPLDAVEIPAGGGQSFEPGGLHIMLIDLVEELVVGETLFVTLSFNEIEDQLVKVLVDER